ncbi:hypothetical protein MCEGKSH29_00237 [Candidatus Nanopelagicaceae bacterium]
MWLSFSQFRISCTRVFDKLICETVLRWCSQRHYREEPSVGARSQIEGDSGLTDHRACLGSKSEIIGSCTDDYFLHRLLVNEIILASSARFPCLNNQSRDRSPPWVWKAISTIKLWAKCIAAYREKKITLKQTQKSGIKHDFLYLLERQN